MEAWRVASEILQQWDGARRGSVTVEDDSCVYISDCMPPREILQELSNYVHDFVVMDPPSGDAGALEVIADRVSSIMVSGLNQKSNDLIVSFPKLESLGISGPVSRASAIVSRGLESFAGDGDEAWRAKLVSLDGLRRAHLVGADWAWFEDHRSAFLEVTMLEQSGDRSVPALPSLHSLESLVVSGGRSLDVTALQSMSQLKWLELSRIGLVRGVENVGLGRLESLILESVRAIDVPDILLREFPEGVSARPRSPFSAEVRDSPVARARGWSIGPVAKVRD